MNLTPEQQVEFCRLKVELAKQIEISLTDSEYAHVEADKLIGEILDLVGLDDVRILYNMVVKFYA